MASLSSIIEKKLRAALRPEELQMRNESDQHKGRAGQESHFRVLIVSVSFEGKSKVQRQRSVYKVLADELDGGVHALALELYTPVEWHGRDLGKSPSCMGGSA
ncbi:MAG: transcriptional regulator [Waddliaceae bacterium]|nr:transcriptional regulator [Waddliaceae bacterium]